METAPLTFLSAHAMYSVGNDPHLRPGVHLRWFSNPMLGLRTRPVEIHRANLGQVIQNTLSNDVYWTNQLGQPISLPHTVAVGEEIYGYIPYPERYIGGILVYSGVTPGEAEVYGEVMIPDTLDYRSVSAMAPNGWIGGNGIQRIRVKGPLTVSNFDWVDLGKVKTRDRGYIKGLEFEMWRTVGLPVESGARYSGDSDFENQALDRVWRGAPVRFHLHDDFNAAGASGAAPMTQSQEVDRVRALVDDGGVLPKISTVINDMSAPPSQIISTEDMGDGITSDVPVLSSLMLSLIDPGVARYMGFAELDDEVLDEGLMMLYRITVPFNYEEFDFESPDIPESYKNLVRQYIDQGAPPLNAYVMVPTLSDAIAPKPNSIFNRQAVGGSWMTGGNFILRQAELTFYTPELDQPYQYAIRRREGFTAPWRSLNTESPSGFRLGMGINAPDTAASYRERRLLDLEVSPQAHEYEISIMDMWGRWGLWSPFALAAGTLVPPPTPGPKPVYELAAVLPVNDTLRSGKIRIRVPIPTDPSPGSPTINAINVKLLQQLPDGSESLIAGNSLSTPSGQDFPITGTQTMFETLVDGPGLRRGEKMQLVIRARFKAGALTSVEDGLGTTAAIDPRPPAPISMLPDVQYTTKPDSQGNARTKLTWTANPGHAGYLVFRASQRALEPFFDSLGAAGADALAASQDIRTPKPVMAGEIRSLANQLPKNLFTLMTPVPIKPGTDGKATYEATLPGRSRALYVYRVLAVGPTDVEEPWDSNPGITYVAVPQTIKLQAPDVELEDAASGLKVTIRPQTSQRVGRARVFRANQPDVAFASMSLVQEVEVPYTPGNPQTYIFNDFGATRISPLAVLRDWASYTYQAQVQAPVEPGTPPGPWSPPGPPVTRINVPPGPPPPPAIDRALALSSGVQVTWNTPGFEISHTPFGDHYFRILRVPESGGTAQEAAKIIGSAPTEFLDTEGVEGMQYIIELIDPLGRVSQSTPSTAESLTQLPFILPSKLT